MKAYKFGDSEGFYALLLVTNEDIRIVNVGSQTVEENVCKIYETPYGNTRLLFGSGSSFPYQNADGTLCDKWKEININ